MKFNHHPLEIPDLHTENHNGMRHYNCNGNLYPSITTILGSFDKPYLTEWRNNIGHENADKETKRCAKRGTAVHELCEFYLKNEKIPYLKYDVSYMQLFNKMKFVLNKISNVYIQEAGLYSDMLKVAGRVDCIAFYNNKLSIIDYKTSTNPKNENQIQDYYLQETFYALALLEMTGIEVQQIVTIIGVERQLQPQVFVKDFKPFILPLKEKVDKFYQNYQF